MTAATLAVEDVRAAVHLAVRNELTRHWQRPDGSCSCGAVDDTTADDLHPTAELVDAIMRGLGTAVDRLTPVTDEPTPTVAAISRALAAVPVSRGSYGAAEHIAGCLAGSREHWVPEARSAARAEAST